MIVFDASSIVGAALKADSVPARALIRAVETDTLALSNAVDHEIAEVLSRPKFARAITAECRTLVLTMIRGSAAWFEPIESVNECRDPKDDRYLALAAASRAEFLVSSDHDLLILDPWRATRILTPTEYLALNAPA